MRSIGSLLVLALLVTLAILVIVYGYSVIEVMREGRENELVAGIEQGQKELVADLAGLIDEARQHGAYLARHPAVRSAVLDQPEALASSRRLGAALLPYLVSFPRIDGLRIVDHENRLLFVSFRQGRGVGLLPPERLNDYPRIDDAVFASDDEIAVSTILFDQQRVEVPPEDRKIVHLRANIRGDRDEIVGRVILSVYAAPLIRATRRFAPIPGSTSVMLDRRGRRLDLGGLDEGEASVQSSEVIDDALAHGSARANDQQGLIVARAARSPSGLVIATKVPRDVLEADVAPLRGELAIVIGTTLGALCVLALTGLFFSRARSRGDRLREAEIYMERIRHESTKYRSLLEGAADMILVVRAENGQILEINRVAERALGPAGDRAGVDQLVQPGDRVPFREVLRRAATEPSVVMSLPDLHLIGADGSEFSADARFVALADYDRGLVQISLRDRSEQVEIERRLRIADRLGSMGLLTAGVAHEINNPLEAIGNYLLLLDRQGDDPEKRARHVELLRQGFHRIRDIVRDLLRFARPTTAGGRADAAEALRRALTLVDYSGHGEGVKVVTEGLDAPLPVEGDVGGIEQVALNLLLNAIRAVDGSGLVRVRVEHMAASEGRGPMIDIIVEDDGPGVRPEHLQRLFDPFFTTSGGTGLGLAVSYGTMQAMGGSLTVANRPEGGAKFTMRCPAATKDES